MSEKLGLYIHIPFCEKKCRYCGFLSFSDYGEEMYEHYLWQVSETIVRTYLDVLLKEHPIAENDRRLIIQFYKCVCFGLTTEWIRSGMPDGIEQDLHRICELKSGSVEEIIRRCSETA